MATLLLSAAGAAIGSGFGGTILGLSGAVIGRAVGATIGRAIDQRVLGGGSEAVEVGRIERFRVMGASEGTAIAHVWGRVRLAGQVIWASRFLEHVNTTSVSSGGGKGRPRTVQSTTQYSYTVSLAVALCEGRITRLGRIWADGVEIAADQLSLRLYHGDETQLPDPKITAVEGAGNAPSYRGIAYVVIEDLDLSRFGNRIPQFSFEVMRPAQGQAAQAHQGFDQIIPGVCMIPGSGEYALATTPVHFNAGLGANTSANVHTVSSRSDFSNALEALREELPMAKGASLVVSWFGSDLRCGLCQPQPKVEQNAQDGVPMPWVVSNTPRATAAAVPLVQGSPIYGGTPADASVIEAIVALKAAGREVTFYPFLLMDQMAGNALPDPWTGALGQPVLPWRGRITLSAAPGRPASPDRSAAAAAEVAQFFGTAQPSHFTQTGQSVLYSGPAEWSYRRFILHYAYLCRAAGGVDAFCVGSELRGLTSIRGANDSFPAVQALRQLAGEVKAILGPQTQISYAADWSEYFGYHTEDHVYFNMDPLWADPAIDFIGIDNYMPLSDWRDGSDHADAAWGDIYNRDYLYANIAGGEGFDWYYADEAAAAAQMRTPIQDPYYGEPWVFRVKDIRGWWGNSHHERIAGLRQDSPTAWIAGSKPIRFTEYGCAAIDKGTNQPNRFLDPKSSESALPRGSNGLRDDLMQLAYYQVMHRFWTDAAQNPQAFLYNGPMLDFAQSLAWAWDARPFPAFPAASSVWSDGGNYDKGHWLNGRASNIDLSALMAEICAASGLADADLSGARGLVRGYTLSEVNTARAALQPLLLAYPSDVIEREGRLVVQARRAKMGQWLDPQRFVRTPELDGTLELTRASEAELPVHLRISYIEAEGDFPVSIAAATAADHSTEVVSQSELPLVLTASEAATIAERWLAEAQVSRDTARFALPRSQMAVRVGDTVEVAGQAYRIDRAELSDMQLLDAVRVDPNVYQASDLVVPRRSWASVTPALPVYPLMLDLPLITGGEVPQAPHACATAQPWPGPVALWHSATQDDFRYNISLDRAATIGLTQTPLARARFGLWDRGPALRLRIETGTLSSTTPEAVLGGANLAAIGDGSAQNWELFQFASATLVGPKTYDISLRLRGQLGSDALMPAVWPVGSTFVLLDAALQQIDLPLSARGLARSYRFVAADRGYDDLSAVGLTQAFDGIGLRPYAVVHLRAAKTADALGLSWVRRSRIDGDSWQSVEVPLGEDNEAYLLRVIQAGVVKREVTLSTPAFLYTAQMQASDGVAGAVSISVAQLSNLYGAGPARSLSVML